jgi:hypothetical protein
VPGEQALSDPVSNSTGSKTIGRSSAVLRLLVFTDGKYGDALLTGDIDVCPVMK